MDAFGVHSEVGKLRKVIVHRPELSLQRLTPSNHDDLLFDDVIWVERAQYEHDQFVARMRERGVEVYYLRDLLAEALAAERRGPPPADRAGGFGIHRGLVPGRRDPQHPVETGARPTGQACHRRSHGRRDGHRPRRLAQQVARRRRGRGHEPLHPASAPQHPVHPRLVLLDLRRREHQPHVLAGPPARGVQRGPDLSRASHVPGRGIRVLVSARWATTAASPWRTSAAPLSRAGT